MRLIFNAYKRIVSNWTGESIESGLYINSNAREQERIFFVSGGIILLFSSTHVGISIGFRNIFICSVQYTQICVSLALCHSLKFAVLCSIQPCYQGKEFGLDALKCAHNQIQQKVYALRLQ